MLTMLLQFRVIIPSIVLHICNTRGTMSSSNATLCPYFSEGLLFLPEESIIILDQAGIPSDVADRIKRGMMLADVYRCDEIIKTITTMMEHLHQKLSARTAF